jgi:hypothetical protein
MYLYSHKQVVSARMTKAVRNKLAKSTRYSTAIARKWQKETR